MRTWRPLGQGSGDTQGTHRGLRCRLSTRGHTVLCPPASGRAGQCLSLPLWCGIEGVNTPIGDGRQRWTRARPSSQISLPTSSWLIHSRQILNMRVQATALPSVHVPG